jgi:hypothetical protein
LSIRSPPVRLEYEARSRAWDTAGQFHVRVSADRPTAGDRAAAARYQAALARTADAAERTFLTGRRDEALARVLSPPGARD